MRLLLLGFALLFSGVAQAAIFPTIAALKASGATGDAVVSGYNASGDGGGGQFYFDAASSAADDGCTIFGSGTGRWKRIYSGAVNVDWCGANSGDDAQAAFMAAAAFPSVYVPGRSYLMNGSISIAAGQQWKFDGAIITHTDNTKVMFKAVAVDGWSFRGSVTLTGMLSSSCSSSCPGEKGIYVEACRRFRVEDVTATLFLGPAIHIAPGTRGASSLLGDTGQWSNIHVDQSMVGLQVDAGTAAEYQTFTNLNATGNITGAQIAAGNYVISGGNIVANVTNGLMLISGSNNGHGVISAVNINHNGAYNIVADGVSNGFTLDGVHAYADSASTGKIWFKNATTGVAILNSVIDSPIVHDASGTDRILNSWTGGGSFFSVSGSNTAGLVQSGNF